MPRAQIICCSCSRSFCPRRLIAVGARWAGVIGVRGSLPRILKIVTAFTIGHSITLALAAWGLVHVPSQPVEVLIAVSILVSAMHALRPLFPGKEAGIAAFFGLIHGLAFGATLSALGLGPWERVAGILAFNLGIETMQLIVVAAVMPVADSDEPHTRVFVLPSRRCALLPVLRPWGGLLSGCSMRRTWQVWWRITWRITRSGWFPIDKWAASQRLVL